MQLAIAGFVLVWILVIAVVLWAEEKPKRENAQTTTGVITAWSYNEGNLWRGILYDRFEDNLEIELADKTFRIEVGVEKIDPALYEKLTIGREITLTYYKKSRGDYLGCGLVYEGEEFLRVDDAFALLEKNRREGVWLAVGFSAFLLVGAVVAELLVYKRCK